MGATSNDQTVQALRQIKAFADDHAAVVDRVEVALRDRNGQIAVEFTAHLLPAPLQQTTVCIGYQMDGEPT